jgi:hypothetical protein
MGYAALSVFLTTTALAATAVMSATAVMLATVEPKSGQRSDLRWHPDRSAER